MKPDLTDASRVAAIGMTDGSGSTRVRSALTPFHIGAIGRSDATFRRRICSVLNVTPTPISVAAIGMTDGSGSTRVRSALNVTATRFQVAAMAKSAACCFPSTLRNPSLTGAHAI